MSTNVLLNASNVASPGAAVTVTSATPATNNKIRIHNIVCSVTGDGTNSSGPVLFVLRDGATGVGLIIWECVLNAPATGTASITFANGDIRSTLGVTLETTTAPGHSCIASVHASGETILVGAPSYGVITI